MGGSPESKRNLQAVENALNASVFPLTLHDNGKKLVLSFDSEANTLVATLDGVPTVIASL
jgi:Fe-S cluster biogenesis protein NfuA